MQYKKNSTIARSKFIDLEKPNSRTTDFVNRFNNHVEPNISINEAYKRSHYISSFYEMLLSLDSGLNFTR